MPVISHMMESQSFGCSNAAFMMVMFLRFFGCRFLRHIFDVISIIDHYTAALKIVIGIGLRVWRPKSVIYDGNIRRPSVGCTLLWKIAERSLLVVKMAHFSW